MVKDNNTFGSRELPQKTLVILILASYIDTPFPVTVFKLDTRITSLLKFISESMSAVHLVR